MTRLTLLFFLFTCSSYIYTQTPLSFNRFTVEDGLVDDNVLTICQDQYGFIWFGTKNGCSRFDGVDFINYQYNENDKGAIGNGWINKIVRDKNNNLWFAIAAGNENTFMRYDYETDRFVDVSSFIKKSLNIETENFTVWSLNITDNGLLWLSTTAGMFTFDVNNNVAKDLKDPENTFHAISIAMNRDFLEDKDQNLWIVGKGGIFKYFKNTGEIVNFVHNEDVKTSLSNNNCYRIFQDSDNDIWIGTSKGLNRLVSGAGNNSVPVFEHYFYEDGNPNSLSDSKVYDIGEDSKGKIIIATANGLSLLNKRNNTIQRYYNDELNDESINSNTIHAIFKDKHNNLWMGTNGGAGKLQERYFQSFSTSNYKNSISHNKIQFLSEDLNNDLWIATPKGIDVLDRQTGHFRFLSGITHNNKGLWGAPVALFPEKQNKKMWIGTWNGGFCNYDYGIGCFEYIIKEEINVDISNITSIFIDHKKNIWTNSNSDGAFVYNPETKEYKNFQHNPELKNSISSNRIFQIFEDSEGDIWIGTINGLSFLTDFEKGEFKNYFLGLWIYHIIESKDKIFWFATNKGLFRFNKNSGEIKLFNNRNGLPFNSVRSILKEKADHFWIRTMDGIAKLIFKNDTIFDVTTFGKEDGLKIGTPSASACVKLSDGYMAFGGTKGFCIFNPENIEKDTLPPSVIITRLKIRNETVNVNQEINNQVVLKKSIFNTDTLVINHKNNAFSIEFAGIQYNLSQYNTYAYRLDGYDPPDLWTHTGAGQRKVDYMNLPGGNYYFKVKAANRYGFWTDKEASLAIKILPPWWATWWFRILSAIVLISSVLIFYFYRINALKARQRILEQKVAERTSELREANSQLEEKQEEILQQNEEIVAVNNQLKTKNEEIESQKEEIESSRDQLEKAFNNITLLSEFGQKLTSTFDFDAINKMIYDYISSLMGTAAFGIGIYNDKRKIIDFPYFMENGKPVPYFFKELTNTKSLSVRCFKNSEEIVINDLSLEYKNYLVELPEVRTTKLPSSVIHLPLIIENKPIGTITVNSFKKDAYDENDVANLRTLASYISIALDNSKAYRIIRSKNEQISGSIRYGQTIQQAMLPPKEQIDKYFESFILFRPKDIVSGDFYWFATVQNPLNPQGLKKDLHFLAVVDCTGHGVPGAFMSMIGSRLLNDIVIERKIYSPAKILDQLNTMVRKALRQDTTDNHDGMDVCLCRFQQNGSGWQLTYAGAKRPLLYFNQASQKIEEINGTRRSIGGVASRRVIVDFTEETMMVNQSNVFYLSTDGLIDQCDPQKHKFSQKKLIELLHKIHMEPIKDQKECIESELDSFQKGIEQRDDITIMGIKMKQ